MRLILAFLATLCYSVNASMLEKNLRRNPARQTREPVHDEALETQPPPLKRQKTRVYKNRVEGEKLWRRGHPLEVKRRVVCLRVAGLTSNQIGILTGLKETTVGGMYTRLKEDPEIKCSEKDAALFLEEARKQWADKGLGYLATKAEKLHDLENKRVSFADKKKIVCLRLVQKLDFHDIAKQLGLNSSNQVGHIFRRYKDRFSCEDVDEEVENVDLRAVPYSTDIKKRIVCLYKARVTFVDLGKIFDIKYDTMRGIYRKNKLKFECDEKTTASFLRQARQRLPGLKLYQYKKKSQHDELEEEEEGTLSNQGSSGNESESSDTDDDFEQSAEAAAAQDTISEVGNEKAHQDEELEPDKPKTTFAGIFDQEFDELYDHQPLDHSNTEFILPDLADLGPSAEVVDTELALDMLEYGFELN
jgi:hypothetical protein